MNYLFLLTSTWCRFVDSVLTVFLAIVCFVDGWKDNFVEFICLFVETHVNNLLDELEHRSKTLDLVAANNFFHLFCTAIFQTLQEHNGEDTGGSILQLCWTLIISHHLRLESSPPLRLNSRVDLCTHIEKIVVEADLLALLEDVHRFPRVFHWPAEYGRERYCEHVYIMEPSRNVIISAYWKILKTRELI